MAEKTSDILTPWISRVQKARDAREVLSIMDEFRRSPWSDEERARIAKIYVGAPPPSDSAQGAEAEKNDGPVWYEKM
jgi:hypothetical protein